MAIKRASIPLKILLKEKNAKYDNKIKKRFLPRVRRFLLNFFSVQSETYFAHISPFRTKTKMSGTPYSCHFASNAKPSNNFGTLRVSSTVCKEKVVDTAMWIACSSSSPILFAGSFIPAKDGKLQFLKVTFYVTRISGQTNSSLGKYLICV